MLSINRRLGLFYRAETGALAVLWGLLLPIIIGLIAFTIDGSLLFLEARAIENVADAGAYAGAVENENGAEEAEIRAAVNDVFVRNGYDPNPGGDINVRINHPPQSGDHVGDAGYVEVIADRTESRHFSGIFLSADPTIRARAVAGHGSSAVPCVLALDPIAQPGVWIENVGNVVGFNFRNCGVASNSTAVRFTPQSNPHGSISITAGGLKANSLYTSGNYWLGAQTQLELEHEPVLNAPPTADPHADLDIEPYAGCDYNGYSTAVNGGTLTLSPGVYCNGLTVVANNANIVFNSGPYIIDRGDLLLLGGSFKGEGVTFVLTSSTGASYGKASISGDGGTAMEFSAPENGPYAGVLMFQDRNAPFNTNDNLVISIQSSMWFTTRNGNYNNFRFSGDLYFPNQRVTTGRNIRMEGKCGRIISRRMRLWLGNGWPAGGHINIDNSNCPGLNAGDGTPLRLVE